MTQEELSIGMTVLGMRMILVGIGSGIGERMVSDTCTKHIIYYNNYVVLLQISLKFSQSII